LFLTTKVWTSGHSYPPFMHVLRLICKSFPVRPDSSLSPQDCRRDRGASYQPPKVRGKGWQLGNKLLVEECYASIPTSFKFSIHYNEVPTSEFNSFVIWMTDCTSCINAIHSDHLLHNLTTIFI